MFEWSITIFPNTQLSSLEMSHGELIITPSHHHHPKHSHLRLMLHNNIVHQVPIPSITFRHHIMVTQG